MIVDRHRLHQTLVNWLEAFEIEDFYALENNEKILLGLLGSPYEGEPWIGVDLDGTLATYDGFKGVSHIGDPIPSMVLRVKEWLSNGAKVAIFTARVGDPDQAVEVTRAVEVWCLEHLGTVLPVTCKKDYGMIELWDDRSVSVEFNTGSAARSSDLLNLVEALKVARQGVMPDHPEVVSALHSLAPFGRCSDCGDPLPREGECRSLNCVVEGA